MRAKQTLLGLALAVVMGCQAAPGGSPGTTPGAPPGSTPGATLQPAPSPTPPSGIEALVADLVARGAAAKVGSQFLADPLGGEGTTVCVGVETLQTYGFIDHEAALVASSKIDRDDPSKVGGAIVEWIGQPRFWLRDRVIVLYLGDDAATDAVLRDLLGEPFAESKEARPGFLPEMPCQ